MRCAYHDHNLYPDYFGVLDNIASRLFASLCCTACLPHSSFSRRSPIIALLGIPYNPASLCLSYNSLCPTPPLAQPLFFSLCLLYNSVCFTAGRIQLSLLHDAAHTTFVASSSLSWPTTLTASLCLYYKPDSFMPHF